MRRRLVAAAASLALVSGAAALWASGETMQARDIAWLRSALAAAPVGGVIDVPPGEYRGTLDITRPVHLRGGGRATLRGDGTTHVLSVQADDVTIEGFAIRESGQDLAKDHAAIHTTGARTVVLRNDIRESLHGVYVRGAPGARIEGNTIVGRAVVLEPVDPTLSGAGPDGAELCEVTLDQSRRGNGIHIWNSQGHVIAANVIRDTRDGVYFSFVDNSEVRENEITGVRYGLHYMYSDGNRFARNVFRDNAAGAALMNSSDIELRDNRFVANRGHRAYGLLLQTVERTRIVGNEIAGNTMGLFTENGHANVVEGNRIAGNYVGVHVSDSSDANVFSENQFIGNVHAVETSGRNHSNQWSHAGRGNYWENAARTDLDRDGIGDLVHRELDLFGDLRRPMPAIGLLSGGPGERLLRFVHARIGLPGLSGVVDDAPLVSVEGPHRGGNR